RRAAGVAPFCPRQPSDAIGIARTARGDATARTAARRLSETRLEAEGPRRETIVPCHSRRLSACDRGALDAERTSAGRDRPGATRGGKERRVSPGRHGRRGRLRRDRRGAAGFATAFTVEESRRAFRQGTVAVHSGAGARGGSERKRGLRLADEIADGEGREG